MSNAVVQKSDGSREWFDRRSLKGPSVGWESSVKSLDPVMEPNALALPLVGGDTRSLTKPSTKPDQAQKYHSWTDDLCLLFIHPRAPNLLSC